MRSNLSNFAVFDSVIVNLTHLVRIERESESDSSRSYRLRLYYSDGRESFISGDTGEAQKVLDYFTQHLDDAPNLEESREESLSAYEQEPRPQP